MSECKHLWHTPRSPEDLSIECMTCGTSLLAVQANLLSKRLEKAESRIRELEAPVPSERDVIIKAKAQFPAGVSVGEVVTAIIEKVGMVGVIHKHLGDYLDQLEKKS